LKIQNTDKLFLSLFENLLNGFDCPAVAPVARFSRADARDEIRENLSAYKSLRAISRKPSSSSRKWKKPFGHADNTDIFRLILVA